MCFLFNSISAKKWYISRRSKLGHSEDFPVSVKKFLSIHSKPVGHELLSPIGMWSGESPFNFKSLKHLRKIAMQTAKNLKSRLKNPWSFMHPPLADALLERLLCRFWLALSLSQSCANVEVTALRTATKAKQRLRKSVRYAPSTSPTRLQPSRRVEAQREGWLSWPLECSAKNMVGCLSPCRSHAWRSCHGNAKKVFLVIARDKCWRGWHLNAGGQFIILLKCRE